MRSSRSRCSSSSTSDLPSGIPDARLAKFKPLSAARAILALRNTPPALIRKILNPWSLLRKSLAIPSMPTSTNGAHLEVELPAGNGVGTARAIARAYSAFAEGGAELGITAETLARITAAPDVTRAHDEVLGVPTYFSLGFARPGPDIAFGSSPRAFGAPGAGGSFGFADPDARLGYAYVTNKLDFWLIDDPREKGPRDALYRSIVRLAARPHRDSSRWGRAASRAIDRYRAPLRLPRVVDRPGEASNEPPAPRHLGPRRCQVPGARSPMRSACFVVRARDIRRGGDACERLRGY